MDVEELAQGILNDLKDSPDAAIIAYDRYRIAVVGNEWDRAAALYAIAIRLGPLKTAIGMAKTHCKYQFSDTVCGILIEHLKDVACPPEIEATLTIHDNAMKDIGEGL